MAMPDTEPGPVGTCCSYSAQPGPTGLPAGAAVPLVVEDVGEVTTTVVVTVDGGDWTGS
ncbi:hypothetical protein MFM001_29610 [Mycobacterium sp. MFM001]|nr:hypothetical protein MFM001_29610 [Mycobacterium sp. MFM001]